MMLYQHNSSLYVILIAILSTPGAKNKKVRLVASDSIGSVRLETGPAFQTISKFLAHYPQISRNNKSFLNYLILAKHFSYFKNSILCYFFCPKISVL